MEEADVVVIGAGLAGLCAARGLQAAGRKVVVLEGRDRVGGRTLNQEIVPGKIVEMGGQWVGPTQDRLYALAAELGIATFPTHGAGRNIVEWDGSVRRYRGSIPRISPAVLLDFARAQARLDSLARRVPLDAPWKASEFDTQTFASWLRRGVVTDGARELFTTICEGVWATEPEDLSLLHFLFYVHSAGGLDRLVSTGGGAQQDRFVGGSQLISIKLAEQLEDVRLDTPVREIAHAADRVTVNGIRARRAVIAVPPNQAARIAYDPPLPAARDQLLQRMPAGAVIKCNVVYGEPFWREDGLSGQGGSSRGPVKVVFDNSPPDGTPGVLLAFVEGGFARQLGTWEERDRREAVLTVLSRLFGPRAKHCEAFYERDWAAEPFTRGCYGAFLPPGAWTQLGHAMRPPVGALHWAGAELSDVWSGYMDGAVRSGEAAARAVGEALS